RWHPFVHNSQHRGRIKSSRAFRYPTAEEQLRPALHRFLYLPVQRRPQVVARLRTDLRSAIKRVAHSPRPHLRDKNLQEGVGDFFDRDEALSGDTTLAAVNESHLRRRLCCFLNVSVLEDNEGIAAA